MTVNDSDLSPPETAVNDGLSGTVAGVPVYAITNCNFLYVPPHGSSKTPLSAETVSV